MKKFSKVLQLLVVFVFMLFLVPQKAEAAVGVSGNGTTSNPFVFTNVPTNLPECTVNVTKTNSDQYIYFKVTCAPGTEIFFGTAYYTINVYSDGFGGTYVPSGAAYFTTKTAGTYYIRMRAAYSAGKVIPVTLESKASFYRTNTSKDKALDVTNGCTPPATKVDYEMYDGLLWYKVNVTDKLIIKMALMTGSHNTEYAHGVNYAIITPSGRNLCEDGPYSIQKDGYNLNAYQSESQERTFRFDERGTYYIVVNSFRTITGELKYSSRKYIPISKVTFKQSQVVFRPGRTSTQSRKTYTNKATITPSNTDGRIASYKVSNSSLFGKDSNGKINPYNLCGNIGTSTVTAYDEYGTKVGSFKVKVEMTALSKSVFEPYASEYNKVTFTVNDDFVCHKAKYFRVYVKESGKWKFKKAYKIPTGRSYTDFDIVVPNLKTNRLYDVAITQYFKSGSKTYESAKSSIRVRTAKTTKPTFTTSLSYGTGTYYITKYPNTIFEHLVSRTEVTAKIKLTVGKLSGVTGYEVSSIGLRNNEGLRPASKRVFNYVAAHATKKSGLPKSTVIKVRTYTKYQGNYLYGPWVQKKINLR